MKHKREKSKCTNCPLRGRTRVWGEGWEKAKLIVIGEAPGRDEDIQGRPFVGASGKFFNFALYQAGIMRSKIWITNVLSCRPPENNIPCPEGAEAKINCSMGFWEEIKTLKERGATTALLMGRTALRAFGIEGSLSDIRGSVYHSHGLILIPTYHPAYLLRMGYAKAGAKVDMSSIWIADLKKAVDISRNGWDPPKEKFNFTPTIEDLTALAEEKEANGTPLALDIETVGGRNNDFNTVVCIGFGADKERAVVVPLLLKGMVSYWHNGHYRQMVQAVNRLLQLPLILQNALYDIPILAGNGFDARMENVLWDTMLMHHCLAEDTPIDTLDFGKVPISELEGRTPFWVVSWDEEKNKLVPAKVLSVWKTADQREDMVRITFWSKSRGYSDDLWIDCTSDHLIPTHNRGWIKAENLQPGDRLIRGKGNKNKVDGIWTHRWVYESFNPPLNGNAIHHIDGKHTNNNPENLMSVTISEHNKYHKDNQYQATMTLIKKAEERFYSQLDIEEAANLYYNVGLSFREVGKELNVDPTTLRNYFIKRGWKSRTRSEATRLRWEKERNCRVVSVTPLKRDCAVYDMTVEKTHTYSANGVIVSNSINPDLPHNLGFIVSLYGDTPYWKSTLRDTDGDVLSLEDEDRHRYNARDCVVLQQILQPLIDDLEESETMWIYKSQSCPLLRPVAEMMKMGVLLDKNRLDKLKKETIKEKSDLHKKLVKIAGLNLGFSLDSPDDLRWLFFGEEPSKFDKLRHVGDYEPQVQVRLKCSECGSTRWYWDDKPHRCGKCDAPSESLTMVDAREKSKKSKTTKVYGDLMKIKDVKDTSPLYLPSSFQGRSTDTGKKTVNLDGLLSLRIAAQNRLEQVKRLKNPKREEEKEILKLLEFLEVYTEYSHIEKLRSTYTSYTVHSDGRVHSSFLIHGTGTGRLCVSPETLIETPQKRFLPKKKVKDITVGDIVYSFDEDRELCLRPVTWVGPTKKKETLIIHTDKGPPLTVSREHLIRLWRGHWRHAKDIKVGDRLLCMPPIGDHEGYDVFFPHSRNRGNGTTGGGRVLVHRWIWEQLHVKTLRGNSVIHHVNEDPKDNRPENLKWLKGRAAHSIEHSYANHSDLLEQAVYEGIGKTGKKLKPETIRKYKGKLRRNHVVTKIEEGPIEQLWDLEVAGTHTFIGNDIALHNSSRNPNMQNLPKKRKQFREPFVAPDGYKFVARDYTNLEVFILAYLIGDEELISFLNNGGNIHDKNTKDLFHISPEDDIWTLARRAAKTFQFGGIQYGGSDKEIHQKIVREVPELNLTMAQYKVARTNWMNAHPMYKRWADKMKQKANKERISETFMGRKRILMGGSRDIEKQAMNTPIQGGAADLINIATVRVFDRLQTEAPGSTLVLQIHDELIIESPEKEVEIVSQIMKEEMETPVTINGKERKFFTSLSIGDNLGQLEEQKED